jgi:hypothetical protein
MYIDSFQRVLVLLYNKNLILFEYYFSLHLESDFFAVCDERLDDDGDVSAISSKIHQKARSFYI